MPYLYSIFISPNAARDLRIYKLESDKTKDSIVITKKHTKHKNKPLVICNELFHIFCISL